MKTTSLIKDMLSGDKRALARLMTYVDNRHDDLLAMMQEVHAHTGRATRIGITGPPGAGKSTLVDKLIRVFRAQGKKVGVVAIDPSSPFSGGAVLGDRIRMMDHGADEGVFIRSLGSRGSHGGLSRATRDIVSLFDAYGSDIILIETVGVGQTELDIMEVADTTVVVLVPESGDTIQTMKAGLMEIADIFVVNKADRDGADRIFAELKSVGELFSKGTPPEVLKVEAVHNKGVEALVEAIARHGERASLKKKSDANYSSLLLCESEDIALSEVKSKLDHLLEKNGSLNMITKDLAIHKNPYLAATQILEHVVLNSGVKKKKMVTGQRHCEQPTGARQSRSGSPRPSGSR